MPLFRTRNVIISTGPPGPVVTPQTQPPPPRLARAVESLLEFGLGLGAVLFSCNGTPAPQPPIPAVVARAPASLTDFGLGQGAVITSASRTSAPSTTPGAPPGARIRAPETPLDFGLGQGSIWTTVSRSPLPPVPMVIGPPQAPYIAQQGRPIYTSGIRFIPPPPVEVLIPRRTSQILVGDGAPFDPGRAIVYGYSFLANVAPTATPRRSILITDIGVNARPHEGSVIAQTVRCTVTPLLPPLPRARLVSGDQLYEDCGRVIASQSIAPTPAGDARVVWPVLVGPTDPEVALFNHQPVLVGRSFVIRPLPTLRTAMLSGGLEHTDAPMLIVTPGQTSVSIPFLLRDSNTGQGKTGLAYNSAGAVASYTRAGGSPTAITLATLSGPTASWSSGGLIEESASLAAGSLRLDVPNAAFVSGVSYVVVNLGFTGVINEAILVLIQSPLSNLGAGAVAYTVTVDSSVTSLPLAGAACWVSTDSAGTNVVAGALYTNASGQVTFYLDVGSYYLWVEDEGFTGTNPTIISVA